jgi:hypothetical protein
VIVAVADARQVIMLMLAIGILRVVVVGVGQPGRPDLLPDSLFVHFVRAHSANAPV